jgi:hypothetical protein
MSTTIGEVRRNMRILQASSFGFGFTLDDRRSMVGKVGPSNYRSCSRHLPARIRDTILAVARLPVFVSMLSSGGTRSTLLEIALVGERRVLLSRLFSIVEASVE